MGLIELIVKTGIGEAIATQLGGLKGNKNAVAETIENNVLRTIIKEHLNDPAYYDKMSSLLTASTGSSRSPSPLSSVRSSPGQTNLAGRGV
jgi:hypothetical protein